MAHFDFITNENFRTSLESDYKEMMSAIDIEAWKATHVLAGSIVEAILIDHLISENLVATNDALKMDFGTALNICKTNKVITSKTADLSSVIKDYRNLIHPGRVIRLNEVLDRNSADVAKALVGMVISEIEGRRRKNYGYTAEQIISKLERDSLSSAIIPHLLKQTNTIEIERLLLRVLPNEYLNISELPHLTTAYFELLELCYRAAFDIASNEVKTKATEKFVNIIKEESESTIAIYGTAFFKCTDLQYLSSDDADLVKKHLFGRLSSKVGLALLKMLEGIGNYLLSSEVNSFIDPLILAMLSKRDKELADAAEAKIDSEWTTSPSTIDSEIFQRVRQWIFLYEERAATDHVSKLNSLLNNHIPF